MTQESHEIGLMCLSSRGSDARRGEAEIQVMRVVSEVVGRALQRRRAEAEILAQNEGLERRVNERTGELRAANRNLAWRFPGRRPTRTADQTDPATSRRSDHPLHPATLARAADETAKQAG